MTDTTSSQDHERYRVVVNAEQFYSIWLADRQLPAGWTDVGQHGTRQDCLNYIETVWTDMRPLSLRRAMEGEPPDSSS